MANVTWTDLETIILSEVSQTEKNKYHRIFGNRIEMDLFITQKQTHRVREEVTQSRLTLHPRGLQPTRPLHPWDSPGKSTGVGGHFLLQGNLPNAGTEPTSPVSPALAGGLLPAEPPGSPPYACCPVNICATLAVRLRGWCPRVRDPDGDV